MIDLISRPSLFQALGQWGRSKTRARDERDLLKTKRAQNLIFFSRSRSSRARFSDRTHRQRAWNRLFLSLGVYHLAKKSGNFGLKSNSKVIFRKFRSEIVEYLQRYSSLSVRNGTTEISLPFAKLCSFQSLISRKQLRKIEVQMVSAISFGWFADFLPYARPNRFILTNGKHPLSPFTDYVSVISI